MELTNQKYRVSEVGMIPYEWDVKELGDIAYVIGGGTPSTFNVDYWNGDINWFTPTEIGLKKYSYESIRKITKKGLENSSARLLPVGSILLTSRAGIGDVSILMKEACTNQGFQSLVAKEGINSEFLYYIVSTLKQLLLKNASGSTFLEISPRKVKAILVAFPPTLIEQTAIATALSDTDVLIEGLEKLIAKKQNIKQGTMQELLSGKKRLNGYNEKWEEKRLGRLVKFQVGFPFSANYFNQKEEGIRLVKNRDLKSDDQVFYFDAEYPKEYLVHNGDILVGMDGDFLLCNWSKGEALLNQRVGRIVKLNDINLTFLYFYLQKYLTEIQEKTASTTVKHLSHSIIENIVLPLPCVEEQKDISDILSNMTIEIEKINQHLHKYKMIKQGMMQELLTGKIRLS
jgi:type I restriction enzyme S subunit